MQKLFLEISLMYEQSGNYQTTFPINEDCFALTRRTTVAKHGLRAMSYLLRQLTSAACDYGL